MSKEFDPNPPRLACLRKHLTHLSEEEKEAAEERFWRYTELVRLIFLDAQRSKRNSTKISENDRVRDT